MHKILTLEDNEIKEFVMIGDTIIISLPENCTTGYRWIIPEYNSAILKLVQDNYVENNLSNTCVIGRGGIRQFIFEVINSGECNLYTENIRSFEKNCVPIETFTIEIDAYE